MPVRQLYRLRTATRSRVPQQRVDTHKLANTVALRHEKTAFQQDQGQREQRHPQPQVCYFGVSLPCCCVKNWYSTSSTKNNTITTNDSSSTGTNSSRCSSTSGGSSRSSKNFFSRANGSHRSGQGSRSRLSGQSSSNSRRSSSSCCTNNLQQRVGATCGNCSEREIKDTTPVFYRFAETNRTWASVVSVHHAVRTLKSGTAGAAAMQRSPYTRMTTAVPRNRTAVEASATALGHNSHLRSEGTATGRCAAFKEPEAAASTARKRTSCATADAAAAQQCGKFDETAAGAAGVRCNMPHNAVLGSSTIAQRVSATVPAAKHEAATPSAQTPVATEKTDQRREAEEAAARARAAEGLWNTLVPERHWGVKSPMFWILLALVLVLHAYNDKREKEKATSYTDADKAEKELREEVERQRQERRLWQTQVDNKRSKTEGH